MNTAPQKCFGRAAGGAGLPTSPAKKEDDKNAIDAYYSTKQEARLIPILLVLSYSLHSSRETTKINACVRRRSRGHHQNHGFFLMLKA